MMVRPRTLCTHLDSGTCADCQKFAKKRYKERVRFDAPANLLKKYGITRAEYRALLEQQGGVCALCLRAETIRTGKRKVPNLLSVDHCHVTLVVRGLLCNHCNRLVGILERVTSPEDRLAYVSRVMDYLSS